jgi:hypothetical protein
VRVRVVDNWTRYACCVFKTPYLFTLYGAFGGWTIIIIIYLAFLKSVQEYDNIYF